MRTKFGLDPAIPALDARLAKLARVEGITYISPLNAMCNAEGCLTIVDEKTQMPSSFDNAHFTFEASRLFIGIVKEQLGEPFSSSSKTKKN